MMFTQNIINLSTVSTAESLKNIGNGLKTLTNIITKTYYYISNPIMLLKNIWVFTVNNSFYVCLVLTMGGFTLYLIGMRKGAKIARISFFSYIAIQIFNTVSKRY
jgi:hypothetical protein